MQTASTMADTVSVEAHHHRNERLKSKPSITAISVPMQHKNKMSHRIVVVQPRHDNIHAAPTTGIGSL